MIRKLMVLGAAGALSCLGLVLAPGAHAATAGGLCQLAGSATFSPALTATGGSSFTYGFTGTLTNCQSNEATPETGGTITVTGATGTNNQCVSLGTTAGTGTIAWNDGKNTSGFSYTTQSVGSLVYVSGTITSGLYQGQTTQGVLAFQTSTPQACLQGGLSSADFSGVDGVGSPS